jgi:hypothetical protein
MNGVESIVVNGNPVNGNKVPVQPQGSENHVDVILG